MRDRGFSPDLISRVTDAVLKELREWQKRYAAPVRRPCVLDQPVNGQSSSTVSNSSLYPRSRPRHRLMG